MPKKDYSSCDCTTEEIFEDRRRLGQFEDNAAVIITPDGRNEGSESEVQCKRGS